MSLASLSLLLLSGVSPLADEGRLAVPATVTVPEGDEGPDAAEPQARSGEGDILVTARRRQERVQEVPIALSVLSGEQLEKTGESPPV